MSEFNLQKCIDGDAVETMGGTRLHFVAYGQELIHPLIMRNGVDVLIYKSNGASAFDAQSLRMVDQKKKVDLSKLPVDTLLNTEYGLRHFSNAQDSLVSMFSSGMSSITHDAVGAFARPAKQIAISANQPWTFWQGGDCPIPDGLEFEAAIMNLNGERHTEIGSSNAYWGDGTLIIAYRLTGKVLDGYEL